MLKINKFLMKDVRCFKGAKEFNIRPLTFLVGANNTGKSTVLGCFDAVGKCMHQERLFEDDPSIYFHLKHPQMQSFENMMRKQTSKNKEFELGFEFIDNNNTESKFELLITFTKLVNSTDSITKKIRFIFDDGEIIFLDGGAIKNDEKSKIEIEKRHSKKIFTILLKGEHQYESLFSMPAIFHYNQHYKYFYQTSEKLSPEEKQFIEFIKDKDIDRPFYFCFRFFAFSSTQSKPQKTYNLSDNTTTSDEVETPLKHIYFTIQEPEHWGKLYDSLEDFGKATGLFTNIEVKKFTGRLGSPFEVELELRKEENTNLINVGFNAGRITGLLIHMLVAKKYIFLMHQPEMHLPRQAEAAFIPLLAELAKQKNNTFIIETHSDYMVDRSLIEIMKKSIKPEDVSLINLEAKGEHVEVNNLWFDKQGYFEDDPPDGYHDSLLSETHKLLGWEN